MHTFSLVDEPYSITVLVCLMWHRAKKKKRSIQRVTLRWIEPLQAVKCSWREHAKMLQNCDPFSCLTVDRCEGMKLDNFMSFKYIFDTFMKEDEEICIQYPNNIKLCKWIFESLEIEQLNFNCNSWRRFLCIKKRQ